VLSEVESEEFNLYVTMPGGATLESTDKVVQDLEERLEALPEKEDIISKIYEEEAIVTVTMKEKYQRVDGRNLAQIKNDIGERIDDIRTAEVDFEQPQSSQRFGGGAGANPGAGFERMMGIGTQSERVVIKGQDFDRMRNVADDIEYYMENLTTIQSVRLNVNENRPEVHLLFDTHLFSQYGITMNAVSSELGTFQNQFSSGLTFKQGTDEYEVTLRNKLCRSQESRDRSMNCSRSARLCIRQGCPVYAG